MNWIMSLIIGGIVGWLASIGMQPNAQMGAIANVVVGVVGAVLGTWMAGLLGFAATGAFARFLLALAGATLLILILGKVGVIKKA